MPTRTVTQDFCDVCFAHEKKKETLSTERIEFSLDGHNYVLLACSRHIGAIREQLDYFAELGTPEARRSRATKSATRGNARRRKATSKATAFSSLTADERTRFRKWAKMPTTRRIADAKVREWKSAGKP